MIALRIVLAWIFMTACAFAQSAQESRRLEEEKRDLLAPTEVHLPSDVQPSLPESATPALRFLNDLSARPFARVEDAERVVRILKGEEDRDTPGDATALTKGRAALLFSRALAIRGGIGFRLFPRSERYALREMVFEGLLTAEGPEEVMTGRELVALFVEAVDYMEKKGGGA